MKSEPPAESFVVSSTSEMCGGTPDDGDSGQAVPTENARAIFVLTDREAVDDEGQFGSEFPTRYAQVCFSFREDEMPRVIEGPCPSEAAHAELWISPESAGARVPGRHARQLLDVATHAVTAAGLVWGPKATLEMTGMSLPGWAIFLIVLLQIGGVVWFGRNLVRRKR